MSSWSQTIKNGRSVVFMFPQMSVQIGLLSKTSFTQVTFVGLLFVVDVSHVSLKVWRYGEGSLTELAFVWLFAGVGSEVPGEVGRSRECLATVLAAVPLLVGFPNSSPARARSAQHCLQCFLYGGAAGRGTAGQLTTRVELGGGEGGRSAGRGRGAVEAGRGQPQTLFEPLVYGTVVGRQARGGRVFVWQERETITDEGIIQRKQPCGPWQAGRHWAGDSEGTWTFLGILGGLRPRQAGAERRDDGHQVAVLILHCGGARGGLGLSLVDSQVERLLCLLVLVFHRFGKVVGSFSGLGVRRLSEASSFTKTEKEAHPGQHWVDGANTGEHWTRLVRSWTRQSGQEN